MNPDYEEIGITPFDIVIRDQVGISMEPNQLQNINDVVQKLLGENAYSKESIKEIREKYLYNISNSAEVGANYIINRLIEYSKR